MAESCHRRSVAVGLETRWILATSDVYRRQSPAARLAMPTYADITAIQKLCSARRMRSFVQPFKSLAGRPLSKFGGFSLIVRFVWECGHYRWTRNSARCVSAINGSNEPTSAREAGKNSLHWSPANRCQLSSLVSTGSSPHIEYIAVVSLTVSARDRETLSSRSQ